MSKFKECKVELGAMMGCYFSDVIYLPISPSLLKDLATIFEEKALDTRSYSSQGLIRENKDYFQDAFDYWKRMRATFDKHNEEKSK